MQHTGKERGLAGNKEITSSRLNLKYNQSASPQILSDFSITFLKKVGDFFEIEV